MKISRKIICTFSGKNEIISLNEIRKAYGIYLDSTSNQ